VKVAAKDMDFSEYFRPASILEANASKHFQQCDPIVPVASPSSPPKSD